MVFLFTSMFPIFVQERPATVPNNVKLNIPMTCFSFPRRALCSAYCISASSASSWRVGLKKAWKLKFHFPAKWFSLERAYKFGTEVVSIPHLLSTMLAPQRLDSIFATLQRSALLASSKGAMPNSSANSTNSSHVLTHC